MKKLLAIIGIAISIFPLIRHISFEDRITGAETSVEIVSVLGSVTGGLFQGFAGLMWLGFTCDAGKGYKPRWLLTVLVLLGVSWTLFYPSGWMLGIPFLIYGGEKIYRSMRQNRSEPVAGGDATR